MKKQNAICFVVTLLIFTITILLPTTIGVACAKTETVIEQGEGVGFDGETTIEGVNIDDKLLSEKSTLKAEIRKNEFSIGETINVSFDKTNVLSYRYVSKGVSVRETKTGSMQFEIDAIDEFGSIDVYASFRNGEIVKRSIYTYKRGNKIYVSDLAKDQAWYECMKEEYDLGQISLEQLEDEYSALSKSFVTAIGEKRDVTVVTRSTTSSRTTKVSGRLFWELKDGTLLPLKMTLIELRDKEPIGSRLIAEGITDKEGRYTFTFENEDEWYEFENGGLDIFIRCKIESKTFKISNDFLLMPSYYFDTDYIENVKTGSNITMPSCYVNYNEELVFSRAVYVQQCMIVGQRFAMEMGMKVDKKINVAYPMGIINKDIAESAFCWGSVFDNCFSAIGYESFSDVDKIIHEYGHYVECSMYNYGSDLLEIIIYNPRHGQYDDHFQDKNDKEYAMELTWSESWASTFSQIAQSYYKSEYAQIPQFADCSEQSGNNEGYDNYIEAFSHTGTSGEAQEMAQIAFLWDLFDGGSNEKFDTVSWGYEQWWDRTTQRGTCTLTDFVKNVDAYCPQERGAIGTILGAHKISPSNFKITNKNFVSSSTAPKLSWKVNGSMNNPNNRFDIVFYDAYDRLIATSPYINSAQTYDSTYEYAVPQSLWQKVLGRYGGTFTIKMVVRGYHSAAPTSGPYVSNYANVTLEIDKVLNITATTNNRIEDVLKLDKGGCCEYRVTFSVSGKKKFETKGNIGTKIELVSEGGDVIARNDGGGNSNASLTYTCVAGQTYVVKVNFSMATDFGETTLCITPYTTSSGGGSNLIINPGKPFAPVIICK